MSRLLKVVTSVLVIYVALLQNSWACSVCFGDPNSPMTHGAKAGVAVLLGIVGAVLGGILAVAFYWMRRAKLLRVQAALRGESVTF
jgi:Mn2+/Fe2+ NRAMP family transporter